MSSPQLSEPYNNVFTDKMDEDGDENSNPYAVCVIPWGCDT